MAAPARFPVGLTASSLAHAGAVLWVAFGGLFFAADPPPQIAGVEVSLISGAAFDALMARSEGAEVSPDQPLLPEASPFAGLRPVPATVPDPAMAVTPQAKAALPVPVTPVTDIPPPVQATPAPVLAGKATALASPALPVTANPPLMPASAVAVAPPSAEPARAPLPAPVGAAPSLPQASVVSALAPQAGTLAPVALAKPQAVAAPPAPSAAAAVPPPDTLQPLPDLPAAQEAGPDTPRPRLRPARAGRQVAEAPPPDPPSPVAKRAASAAPEPAAPKPTTAKKAAAKPATKPAATTDGDQQVNNRRGAAAGAQDGASVEGRAGAKGKVAGNASASNYGGQVLRKISRTKKPKAPARGTVVVGFTIADSGGLAGVTVLRSSGAPALDAVALDHIRRAAPFPAPPEGAKRSFSFEFVGRP